MSYMTIATRQLINKVEELELKNDVLSDKVEDLEAVAVDASYALKSQAGHRLAADKENTHLTKAVIPTKDAIIDGLKAENKGLKKHLSTIDEICAETKTSNPENNTFFKVGCLRDAHDNLKSANKMLLEENAEWEESSDEHYKYYEEESAKASKLNAEKRKLLWLMKGSMTSGAYTRVINDYKLWLAGRGKK